MLRSRLVEAATVLLALAFIGAQFPGPFPLLDNLSNFPAHFGVAFLACTALLAWRGRRAFALGGATAAALALAQVVPWYFDRAADAPAAPSPAFEILVSNVYHSNHRFERIQRLVAEEDPDVVGLVEVSNRWLRKLKPLRERYPHHLEVPDDLHVGLALYSRLPITDARVIRVGDPSTPAIAAALATPDGEVQILLVHPASPVDADAIRRRNAQIEALALHVRDADRPTLLAGDLNLTMWNRGYRPLEDVARLHNARAGHGIGPTWPALGRFGVPIDHILATADIDLRNFRVLRPVGSDHRPIVSEFALRARKLALACPRMHAESASPPGRDFFRESTERRC
jgi:endonuclease/exonuclease/phosphatase (EEP) superfamily protein YafD